MNRRTIHRDRVDVALIRPVPSSQVRVSPRGVLSGDPGWLARFERTRPMQYSLEDIRRTIDEPEFREIRAWIATKCDPASAVRAGAQIIRDWATEVLRSGTSAIGPRLGGIVPFTPVEWVEQVDGTRVPEPRGDGHIACGDARISPEEIWPRFFPSVDSYLALEAQHFPPVERPCGSGSRAPRPKYTLEHLLECGCDVCRGESIRRLEWLERKYPKGGLTASPHELGLPPECRTSARRAAVERVESLSECAVDPWDDPGPNDICTLAEARKRLDISESRERYLRTGGKQGQPDRDWMDVPFKRAGNRWFVYRRDVLRYEQICRERAR
jgi:hypothetical protein